MSTELEALLHMVSELYRRPLVSCPPFERIDIPALLLLAKNNGMEYYIAKKLATDYANKLSGGMLSAIRNFIKSYEDEYARRFHVLEILNQHFDDYLVIKTFHEYPKIRADIDILVHDFDKALKTLLRIGFHVIKYSNQKTLLLSTWGPKVHLHRKITWCDENVSFIDNELIWMNPRIITFGQVRFKIPNINADFLTYLAHINFECFQITLSDMLLLYKLASEVDWNVLLEQTNKHHWERTFKNSIKFIDMLHHTFYPQPCPFTKWNLKHHGMNNLKRISLPMPIPRQDMILGIVERKLVKWAISHRTLRSIQLLLLKAK